MKFVEGLDASEDRDVVPWLNHCEYPQEPNRGISCRVATSI